MEEIERHILEFIEQVYLAWGWPGVVVLSAIESACVPLPSEIILPLAGWMLIQKQGLPPSYLLLAGFAGALGNLLGSLLAYWLGLAGGRPLVLRFGKYVLVSRRDLDRADQWFARYGPWAVFFARLLPVVRTFISFPAGVARMNLLRFCIFTFVGSFPWSLGLAYGGYLLGEHWETLRAYMRPFDIPIILVFLALVAWYIYRHVRHSREDRAAQRVESAPQR